ncbi:aldo/keto reductase [Tepidamorphus sp. 3E244]|uniref:aldo/keto reductase n=1 Tax=Tepidamorphus sp. 3E244 TaxID=3385498 RepID=UPI0038FD0271
MDYRTLGRSGLKVSPICLGTMMFGGRTERLDAEKIIAHAFDAGVNFIDTADVYNEGASEEIVGRAIGKYRDRWVLATKLGNKTGDGPNQVGLSRKYVIEETEASLKRLGTDYLDIQYLHREDHATPLEETIGAFADLMRAGKIRYIGVSNHRSWRVAEIVRICREMNITPPVVSQPYYNAMNRMPEVEHLPACAHFGLGVFPYSPMARGVLSGKYAPGEAPPSDTRAGSGDKRIMQAEFREESLRIAQTLKEHAQARGITPGQFAVAWVLNNKLVTGTIAGPRTIAQWTDYLGALDYTFTAEDEALVDSLVPAGHPSTPGYSDPAYPLEGRVARSGQA